MNLILTEFFNTSVESRESRFRQELQPHPFYSFTSNEVRATDDKGFEVLVNLAKPGTNPDQSMHRLNRVKVQVVTWATYSLISTGGRFWPEPETRI